MSSNANNNSASSYHRSDPLDIPLIDNHILSHLLLPRIINSIKLAFPKVYLDWTTGTTTTQNDNNAEESSQDVSLSSLIRDSLFWKRIVENILRLCLLLGSFRHIYNSSSRRNNSSNSNSDLQIKTPAMNSLGMFLQPIKNNSSTTTTRLQQYTKIFALALTTIIIPMIYKELKMCRMKQLEERENQLRLNEIRSELGSRNSIQQQHRSTTTSQLSTLQIIQKRAKQRQQYIISCITDCILGMSDIFIPPIRLINYLSYLWGMSCTPQLGMRLVGWEYAPSIADGMGSSAVGSDNGGQQQQQQHRHANFQYSNRRVLVEEALRTVSMVIPPRRSNIDNNGTEDRQQPITSQLGNDRMNGNEERRRETRRGGGWMRKRFLSFMGVADDNNNTATPSSITDTTTVDSNERKYTLTCSMCHVDNPSIPYIASCGHCYCYICLRMAVTDDLTFRCLDCGQVVVSSSRESNLTITNKINS